MKFPATNKIRQRSFGENAKLLEELAARPDLDRIIKMYFVGLGILIITIFSIIVTVRLALAI